MTLLRRPVRRLAALLALTFATNLATSLPAHAASYPLAVTDFGRTDQFPLSVGPYLRGQVTAYAPALTDFSIGYDSRSFSLSNAVTLYFYPHRHGNVDDQLEDEERQVLRAHGGARILGQRDVTLTHGQASHDARLVSFEFEGEFAGRTQPLASQLLLVFRERGVFMVRSTAPVAQGVLAERAMLDLLQRVDWDAVPDR